MKDSMRQTALIVEDDPGTRHVLSSTLATAGIDSIHAATGAAMWQQLDHTPDIIILDLSLPDGDGLELLRQLRQTSDVPVLIHSRRSDEIERIIGIEIGADDFMPKPCNMRELLARVRWGDTTLHPLLVAAAADLVDGEVDRAEIREPSGG